MSNSKNNKKQGPRKFPASVLQRQLNNEEQHAGVGGGGGGGPSAAGAAPAAARGRPAALRPGQLRAGVAPRSAIFGMLSGRRPPPASLLAPAAGGSSSKPMKKDGVGDGPGDLFQFYRLLLPSLDDERGRYHLKETLLAKALCSAVGRNPATDPGAARVIAWQKNAAGASAGSLPGVAREELVSE